MKRYIRLFLDAAVEAAGGSANSTTVAAVTEKVYTNDKIVEIKKAQAETMAKMDAETDFDKKLELSMELFKLNESIKAEVASIKRAEAEQAKIEARNQRLALAENWKAAILAEAAVLADKKSTDEQKAAASEAEKVAGDIVKNELLAKYATSTPSKSVATGTTAQPKGAKAAEIIALHTANLAAGMTPTESKKAIEAAGHSRGTTGAVVLAWEKEQGLK